jgi:hypothetical protein
MKTYTVSKLAIFAVAFLMVAGITVLVSGQQPQRTGLPDDWTHHNVIFSNPGTAAEALAQGRVKQWYKIVTDPRYNLQQLKRSHVSTGATKDLQELTGSSSSMDTPESPVPEARARPRAPAPHRDWAFSLGNGTVAQNMFPAKYTFNPIGTPSCATDYVAYGLNVAGATSGQANLVALNNLYAGSSPTGICSGPTVYWAYNVTTKTGGKVNTSPVLSLDGNEVIFVESSSSNGSVLHVLRWNSSDGGSVGSAKAPSQTGTSFGACTGSSSCLVSINLGTSSSNTTTNSSPYYDYNNDIVYVGDDAGALYKVTPVLGSGTPVVSTISATTFSPSTSGTKMTGPLLDISSNNVFVGSTNGFLYAVNVASNGFSLATHSSLQIGHSSCGDAALIDAPVVDSANGMVFATSMVGTDDSHTVVVQAATTGNNSPSGSSGWSAAATADVGRGDNGCSSSGSFYAHAPTFDNTYYTTPSSGHLLVGGTDNGTSTDYPALWSVAFSSTPALLASSGTEFTGTGSIPQNGNTNHAEISPLTEIFNGSDYLFFGTGGTTSSGYTGLFGFTFSGGAFTAISGSPITTGYPHAQGGTSGIVIDNISSQNQASSIYFTTLAPGGSTNLCGSGKYCAVKLTQAGLN